MSDLSFCYSAKLESDLFLLKVVKPILLNILLLIHAISFLFMHL